MKNYDVSFIIPAYNEKKNIGKCIQSIISAVKTNRFCSKNDSKVFINNYEIIVSDNCSKDNTAEIARSYGVRVIQCKRKGVTHARQLACENARYPIHAYIDADSYIPDSNWLECLNEFTDPTVVAISGPVRYPESSWIFNKITFIFYIFGKISHYLIGPMMQGGNFVVRRTALDKIGGHSTNIEFFGEDTDLASRLSKVGKVKFLFSMWNNSSSRRYRNQGIINTGVTYTLNFIWIHTFHKPFSQKYMDYRD